MEYINSEAYRRLKSLNSVHWAKLFYLYLILNVLFSIGKIVSQPLAVG